MRLIVNITGALVALALAAWLGWHAYQQRESDARLSRVASEVRRLEAEIKLRAATGEVELTGRGWPVNVQPEWFGAKVPDNELLPPDRPWLEIAPPADAHLLNPRVRISKDRATARFWYNPYQGVVRARVPYDLSDLAAVQTYNRINSTDIDTIFSTQETITALTDPGESGDAGAEDVTQVGGTD